MQGPTGNLPLLLHEWDTANIEATRRAREHWSLQHRHADGKRWLDVGKFPTKEIAKTTLLALVAHGHGVEQDFRVERVTISE